MKTKGRIGKSSLYPSAWSCNWCMGWSISNASWLGTPLAGCSSDNQFYFHCSILLFSPFYLIFFLSFVHLFCFWLLVELTNLVALNCMTVGMCKRGVFLLWNYVCIDFPRHGRCILASSSAGTDIVIPLRDRNGLSVARMVQQEVTLLASASPFCSSFCIPKAFDQRLTEFGC